MTETISWVVKTITGEVFVSEPQSLYHPRPILSEYLRNGRPFTIKTLDGEITINPRYILYIQEVFSSDTTA